MLAQSFKTAEELYIPEEWKNALIKTLVLLETDKIVRIDLHNERFHSMMGRGELQFTGHFNMGTWGSACKCGTVACIGGTAELIGNVRFDHWKVPRNLFRLFYPDLNDVRDFGEITIEQAARALREYLTTGDANWKQVVDNS